MRHAVQPAARRLAVACLALLAATHAGAATFTVGPAGDYATLPLAISATDADAGTEHEIRLQAGSFTDQPSINYVGGKTLQISGGWDDTFTTPSKNVDATIFTLPADGIGRPFLLSVSNGNVTIEGFAARNGNGNGEDESGGMFLGAGSSGVLTVYRCDASDNLGSASSGLFAGGIDARTTGSARLTIRECDVRGNTLEAGSSATGGGIFASAQGTSQLVLERVFVVDNTLRVRPDATDTFIQFAGGGIYAAVYGDAVVDIRESMAVANTIDATGAPDAVSITGTGLHVTSAVNGAMRVRGSIVRSNRAIGDNGAAAQAFVFAADNSRLDLGDSEITRGEGTTFGLFLFAYGDNPTLQLHATNLTVADNAGEGVRGNDRFPVTELGSFHNSIVANNGIPSTLPAWMSQGNNRVNVPTTFADPAIGNYSLVYSSTAIDAGNDTPPGGLGTFDAGGGPRVVGAHVDLGAYEFPNPPIFRDGFEG